MSVQSFRVKPNGINYTNVILFKYVEKTHECPECMSVALLCYTCFTSIGRVSKVKEHVGAEFIH